MGIENIQWRTSGFLKDASYTFELKSLLEGYKDSFPGAESLMLNLDEILVGTSSKKSRVFSEDGKHIEINITEWRERDKRGKFKDAPDANSVYNGIKFVLNKAVEEYAEKFLSNDK